MSLSGDIYLCNVHDDKPISRIWDGHSSYLKKQRLYLIMKYHERFRFLLKKSLFFFYRIDGKQAWNKSLIYVIYNGEIVIHCERC